MISQSIQIVRDSGHSTSVLLAIKNPEDRRMIRQFLPDSFGIEITESGINGQAFDLCILDDHFLLTSEEVLKIRKEEAAPVFLPILLLSQDQKTVRTNPEISNYADDVIYIPVSTAVLQSRIELLLQSRRYSLELEQKNRELKRKNERLRIFEQAIDSSNSGILITDAQRENNPIIYSNKRFNELTGYSKSEVVGRNCRFLQNDDRNQKAVNKIGSLIQSGDQGRALLRNYRKDGTMFWNELNIAPIRNEEGEVSHFVGIQNDVTELIEVREQLKQEKEKYQLITEHSTDMISRHDLDGNYLYASPASECILGYSPDELLGTSLYDTIHPEDYEVLEKIHRVLLASSDPVTFSYRRKTKEGAYVWIETTARSIRNPDTGEIFEIQANTRDITKRKNFEQQLEREKMFVDTVINSMPNLYCMIDDDLNLVHFNTAFEKTFGYSAEELYEIEPSDIIHQTDLDWVRSAFKKAFNTGKVEGEITIVRKDGTTRPHYVSWKKFSWGNGKNYLIANGIDITEQKKTLKKLQERVKEQKCLYQIAKLNGSPETVEELLESAVRYLPDGFQFPEITEATIRYGDNLFATSGYCTSAWSLVNNRKKIENRSLEVEVVYLKEKPELDEGPFLNEERYLIDAVADMLASQIQRIRVQIKLKESEQRWEQLVQKNPGLIQIIADGVIEFINPAGAKIYGTENPEDLIGKSWTDFVSGEKELQAISEKIEKRTQNLSRTPETHKAWTVDGQERYVELQSVPVQYQGDEALMTVGQDVTTRIRYEKQLRTTNKQLEAAQEIANIGYWWHDIGQNKSTWSDREYEIWEVDPQNFTPNVENILELVHPEDRDIFRKPFDYVFKDKDIGNLEYRITTPGGNSKWIMEKVSLHRDENDNPVRYEGITQDITEQKRKEEVIRKALKEKETLLMEVHHRVKNNLAVISGLLELQEFNAENQQVIKLLAASKSRIKTMALIHESLYKYSSFSDIDFRSYLGELIGHIQNISDRKKKINIELESDPVKLNINQAVPCGLILNEVITNACQHAFKGRDKGTVAVRLSRQDDRISLSVKDNGIGMPENFDYQRMDSMGFTIINTLISQLGSKLKIKDDGGTVLSFSFPVQALKGSSSNFI